MFEVTYNGTPALHDGTTWSSDDASLALWLNSAFPALGDHAAFVADLEEHGVTVIVHEPQTAE